MLKIERGSQGSGSGSCQETHAPHGDWSTVRVDTVNKDVGTSNEKPTRTGKDTLELTVIGQRAINSSIPREAELNLPGKQPSYMDDEGRARETKGFM